MGVGVDVGVALNVAYGHLQTRRDHNARGVEVCGGGGFV